MVEQLLLLRRPFIRLTHASPSLPLMAYNLAPTQMPHRYPLLPVCREPCEELEVAARHGHLSLLLFELNLFLAVLFLKLGTQAFLGPGQPGVKHSGQNLKSWTVQAAMRAHEPERAPFTLQTSCTPTPGSREDEP